MGGFVYDNGTRAVTIGHNVHVVFARATPVDGSPGTPSYAVTAAVALAVFRKLDAIRAHCRNLRRVFDEALGELPVGITHHKIPDSTGDSFIEMYFMAESSAKTKTILKRLGNDGVNCIAMTGPMPNTTALTAPKAWPTRHRPHPSTNSVRCQRTAIERRIFHAPSP